MLTCFKNLWSRILTRPTATVFEANSSVVVGERWYIQLIGRDDSGDISKLETFVLDGDMWKVSWIKLSDCWVTPDYYKLFQLQAEGKFDLKLIPEFVSASRPSVVEWMEKAELVSKMCQVKHMDFIIPLRLMGGAFTVFQQLKEEDKRYFNQIKAALYTAFAADRFMAFDLFVERWLHHGESVDVYLAELRRLSVLFGGISDQGLACVFAWGLPDQMKSFLCASTRMDGLSIDQLLAWAWASIKDNTIEAGLAVAAVQATWVWLGLFGFMAYRPL